VELKYFEDVEIGDEFITPARTITEADVVAFAALSGDYNPLHTDEEFSKKHVFGQRIAHGLLGLAITGGLKSREGTFEGTVVAYVKVTCQFKAPIFFGDTVFARCTITQKKDTSKTDRGIIVQKVELINQRHEIVQESEDTVLLLRREAFKV